MNLKLQKELSLFPTSPFHFEGTFHKPSHFHSKDLLYQKDNFWQSMRFNNNVLGLKLTNIGTANNPEIKLGIYSSQEINANFEKELIDELSFRFDLNADMASFINDCSKDELLKPILEKWIGMRVSVNASFYEFLVITTVLQDATINRTVHMFDNLFMNYGSKICFDNKTLAVIWEPRIMELVEEIELRNIKLGFRAKTLKRQAHELLTGKFDENELRKLPTNELKKLLLQLYGIGPASVWYLLFEVFKRYEVFDYISPWEQKIYSKLLFNEELVENKLILDDVNKRWGKWKMLAAHYIFEDLFWQRKNQNIPWLEKLIRI